ncbi:MAG: glycosyltransferase family A protein [Patescibacteria group bacterium]
MSQATKVDVIIPTYNGLPYLKATVDSVLAQTHQDWELYIIDDGSTDKTEDYVKTIKDARVHYHKKKNGGQAEARNLGIKMSDSPFVALLDADDIWHKDKLERQVKALADRSDYGMVYGFHKLIDENDKEVGEVKYSKSGDLYHYLLGGNRISGSASMVLIRREVFDAVGVFREDFLIGEDWEMWLRIAKDYKIYCIEDYLASLRVLPEGMQQDYIKMAKGLDYMLPLMLEEFKPNLREAARLKGVCYFDSSLYYFMGGDVEKARRNFRKLVVTNPARIERNATYIRMYARLLAGGSWHYLPRKKVAQFIKAVKKPSGKK